MNIDFSDNDNMEELTIDYIAGMIAHIGINATIDRLDNKN